MNSVESSRLIIRKAKSDENERILEIFTDVTDWLQSKGINQWDYSYPNLAIIERDIASQNTWVSIRDKHLVGTITLNQDFDEQYSQVLWENRIEVEDAWCIHRLAVDPKHFSNKIGKKLCLFAEEYIKKQGGTAIRLDAYSINPISNSMYQKLGYFLREGNLYFHKNEIPFNAYEKLLLH